MFNIEPIEIDEEKLLKEIIKLKTNKEIKKCLESKEKEILEAYKIYEINKNNLESIKSLESFEKIKKELNSCYDNNSLKIKKIREQMLASTRKCPYCLIFKTTTLDHYLSKSYFPEFSVYSKNLIPSCSDCNKKKGVLFCDNNNIRHIINFYYDNLPEYQFLFIDLCCEEGIPKFKKINLKFKDKSSVNLIIKNHFENLKLRERYEEEIESKLQIKFETFKNSGLKRNEEVEDILNSEIEALKKRYGNNYWEVALDFAIISNSDVLKAIVTNTIE